jgi:hypothetical protein
MVLRLFMRFVIKSAGKSSMAVFIYKLLHVLILCPTPDSPEAEEIYEEDYYSIVGQAEEDIYQDLCYIERQPKKVRVL